jgi:hypothetical protein
MIPNYSTKDKDQNYSLKWAFYKREAGKESYLSSENKWLDNKSVEAMLKLSNHSKWTAFLNSQGYQDYHAWLRSITGLDGSVSYLEKYAFENYYLLSGAIFNRYFSIDGEDTADGTTVYDKSVPSNRHEARQGWTLSLNGAQHGTASLFDMWQGETKSELTVITSFNITSNNGTAVGMWDTGVATNFFLSRNNGYMQATINDGTNSKSYLTTGLASSFDTYVLRFNRNRLRIGIGDNLDVTMNKFTDNTVNALHSANTPLTIGKRLNGGANSTIMTGTVSTVLLSPRELEESEIIAWKNCRVIPNDVVICGIEEESGTTLYVWTNIEGLTTSNVTMNGGTWTANNTMKASLFNQHGGTISGSVVIPNTLNNIDAAGNPTQYIGKAKQNLTIENDLGSNYKGGFDAAGGNLSFSGTPEKVSILPLMGLADLVSYAELVALTNNSYLSFTDSASTITDFKIYCAPQFAEFIGFLSGETNAQGTDDKDIINHVDDSVLSQVLTDTPASTDTLFLKGMEIDLSSFGGSATYHAGDRLVNPFFKTIVDDDTESNIEIYESKLTGNKLKSVRIALGYVERNLVLTQNYYVKEGRTLTLYLERLAERELEPLGITNSAGTKRDDRIELSGTGTEELTITSDMVSPLSASTTINYVPALGSAESINVLMVGDSQANQMVAAFSNDLNARTNLTATFHGTQVDSTVKNEAYPGQTTSYFIGASSPFWVGGVLDFDAYATAESISSLEFVTIQLGANDAYTNVPVATSIANLKTLIDEIQSVFACVVLVCLPNKGSSQANFTSDYTEDSRYLAFRRNISDLQKALIEDEYFNTDLIKLVDLDIIFDIDTHFANALHGNSAWNTLASIQLGDAVESQLPF